MRSLALAAALVLAGCATAAETPNVRIEPVPRAALEAADCDADELRALGTVVQEGRVESGRVSVLPEPVAERCRVEGVVGGGGAPR